MSLPAGNVNKGLALCSAFCLFTGHLRTGCSALLMAFTGAASCQTQSNVYTPVQLCFTAPPQGGTRSID